MTIRFCYDFAPCGPSTVEWKENYGFPGLYFGSGGSQHHQFAHSHQVVYGCSKSEHPADSLLSSMTGFPEISDGFYPAEDFLHTFPQALTGGVTRMAGGAAIDGGGAARAILGHMRDGIQGTQRLDEFPCVKGLITSHGHFTLLFKPVIHYLSELWLIIIF
jgi:hypothetical protein